MAATSGFCIPSCWSLMSGRSGLTRGLLNSRMSAPPQKAFADPMRMATFTAGSPSAFVRCAINAARSALLRPLTGGVFSVMTAMPSRAEYEAASLAGALFEGCIEVSSGVTILASAATILRTRRRDARPDDGRAAAAEHAARACGSAPRRHGDRLEDGGRPDPPLHLSRGARAGAPARQRARAPGSRKARPRRHARLEQLSAL